MESNAPSHHTVFNCFRQFQHNKFCVQHAPPSGRPSTSVTEQTIDAVRKIIEDDLHSTYQQIEAILGISSTAINSIIHDYLNLRKVGTQWVPHQGGKSETAGLQRTRWTPKQYRRFGCKFFSDFNASGSQCFGTVIGIQSV